MSWHNQGLVLNRHCRSSRQPGLASLTSHLGDSFPLQRWRQGLPSDLHHQAKWPIISLLMTLLSVKCSLGSASRQLEHQPRGVTIWLVSQGIPFGYRLQQAACSGYRRSHTQYHRQTPSLMHKRTMLQKAAYSDFLQCLSLPLQLS